MCFTVSSFTAHSQYYLIGMCLFTCRSYEAPSPDHRAIADSVSSLVTAVQNSLRHGCVRNCMFVISFRCEFNFLFSGKGRRYCQYNSKVVSTHFYKAPGLISWQALIILFIRLIIC